MPKLPQGGIRNFPFRDLPQNILIGTASDRYAGWIGQIYTSGRHEKGITRRSHKVGDKNFTEETLPVESVAEYFEHFPILEIDYTFYRPLLESKGSPVSNFHVGRTTHRKCDGRPGIPGSRNRLTERFSPFLLRAAQHLYPPEDI